jgi:MYXO-CTERM domain-containing protein
MGLVKRLLLLALLLWPTLARAESGAPLPGCMSLPSAIPAEGTTLPANIPALVFRPAVYTYSGARAIAAYALGLREVGGAAVPIQIDPVVGSGPVGYDAGGGEQYLVRLQRALTPGEVVLGFDDDCGPYPGTPMGPTVRNERFRYTVGPAQPLPTRIGTAKQAHFGAYDPMMCGLQSIDFEVALDPALAAFPLLRMETRAPDGRTLSTGFSRPVPGTVRGTLIASCRAIPGSAAYLRQGEDSITLSAELVGGAPLPPVTLAVQVDCSPDAGCPAPPDASPDAVKLGADAAPDHSGSPSLPPARDADPSQGDPGACDAAGRSPAGGGCSCTVDRRVPPSGTGLAAALLGVIWVRRRRTASRTRAGRPDRCTPSVG